MKNFRTKLLIIVATVLLCIYGVVGIPWPLSQFGQKAKENFNDRIKLGLDLKGGSQLVEQVQMQDAMRSAANEVINRLRESLNAKQIPFAAMEVPPLTFDTANDVAIIVKGVPPEKTGDFRTIATEAAGRGLEHRIDRIRHEADPEIVGSDLLA